MIGAVFAYALPETKDLSLEQMDVLFGVIDEETRKHDLEMAGRAKKVENIGLAKGSNPSV